MSKSTHNTLSVLETIHKKAYKRFDNISWLPKGSYIDVVLFNHNERHLLPAEELVSHTFLIPFIKNNIILTNHAKRGLQIPGGHKEAGENQLFCTVREDKEEIGLNIHESEEDFFGLTSLGYARIYVPGPKPEGSKYPHPYSVMTFFGKECHYSDLSDYTAPLSECVGVSIMNIEHVLKNVLDIGELDKIFIQHYHAK